MNGAQRAALARLLSARRPEATMHHLLDATTAGLRQCARCGSDHVGRWGLAHGLDRFRCRACCRTFNALTGTTLARLRYKE